VQANDELPVVLVHGALRSRVGLVPTAFYLRRFGLRARAFGYPTRTGTLDDHGRRLESFVRGWLGEEPPPVLGFLTHSMGGLVVRAYLAAAERLGLEQRIVMLSPPNNGAQLAVRHRDRAWFRALYGDAARELAPASVAALPALPASARVLVLAGARGDGRGWHPHLDGDDDGVVAVGEMGLPGIEPIVVGGVHSWLQWRPAVLDRAGAFLSRLDR
jgi:hypothetical protein